ncbi:hypothetical protein D9758_016527 [Tetrapyrgos nigripes]|uniref:Uncharacterized protein n=1 Tax=Tetrapyrgos nigripes TaxID=182062 RepID=A0A8H5CL05_9AGAR|nr:hypothetical protein D9758_016527 [Tetrapyrgos nigripes]
MGIQNQGRIFLTTCFWIPVLLKARLGRRKEKENDTKNESTVGMNPHPYPHLSLTILPISLILTPNLHHVALPSPNVRCDGVDEGPVPLGSEYGGGTGKVRGCEGAESSV